MYVRDYMSVNVLTVSSDTSVTQVQRLMVGEVMEKSVISVRPETTVAETLMLSPLPQTDDGNWERG